MPFGARFDLSVSDLAASDLARCVCWLTMGLGWPDLSFEAQCCLTQMCKNFVRSLGQHGMRKVA